ncbi:T9SS C-terminal target domain-containing protein [Bernardetia litoralis]|uniref:T9SS C-terminal target domain-containing protein n=1 Tax=Bernardetia litoralis TaxID=999 RepID=UPI0002D513D7|nr:T9SS C-terminal target domain-containing protein [Bernardetia litoralis]
MSYSQFDRHTHNETDPEPCATDIIHQRKLAQDPEYRANYEKMNNELRDYIQNSSNQRREGDLIIIPLVVHVMHTGGAIGSVYNPTDARINDMIAYLNQMYRNQTPFNTANGVDVEIQFELAQRTENCTATTGINRVDASVVAGYDAGGINLDAGQPGVPEIQIKDLSRWSNTDYYNIWLVNKFNGVDGTVPGVPFTAGYAYFPGANANIDGTVMLATQINPGEITLPHEIGHALQLYHTFQGSGGVGICSPNADCTTQGDFVCDTAPHDANQFQCTNNACDADLTVLENTMSYSGCQDKFTDGQRTRMRAALETQRPGLISSLGSVPPPASLPAVACIPTAGTPSFSGMERVRFNTIDVTSGAADDEGSYVDRSCGQGTTVLAGSTHELKVNSFFTNSHKVRAYIDYNNDGDFDDAGEEVLTSDSGIEHTSSVIIPITGVPFNQPLRMRVVGDFQGNTTPTACTVDQGQAEDFSVIIESNLPCDITAITAGTQTACEPTTNEYTQEVTVTFANEPSSGNLVVNGQVFPLTASPQTVTLVGLDSDGLGVDVTATFSENGTCPFTETALFIAPDACEPRITLGTITPTTYCAGETISIPFTAGGTFNAGNTFTAQLSSAGGNFVASIATQAGTNPITITIPTTAANGTGYKIRVFSSSPSLISNESPAFTINALPLNRTIIANPNTVNTGQGANIDIANSQTGVTYQLQNVTTGNTNVGTPVAGTGGLISIPTGNLTATTDFRVIATNAATCERTLNTTTVTVVVPCTISAITEGITGVCNSTTNLYSKEVTITYIVPPATGDLVVNGQNFPITTSPQTVILTGLTANGNSVDVTASFSDDAACTFTQTNAFTAPTPCNIPTIILGTITPTEYCPTATISVPFTFSGAFGASNTFTAQLSDENGNFVTPLVENTFNSPISLFIPASATASTNYKVRVIGSDPFATSAEFGITVLPLPLDRTIIANPAIIALGSSSNIEIPNSQTTVNYQLQDVSNGNANIGTPQTGTGGTLSIPTGNLTSTTDFRVVATNIITGCERVLNTTTVTINAPEINVISNSTSILNGDITPSTADNTDFGSQLTCNGFVRKTFTIQNTGTLDLDISDISVTGTDFTFPLPTFPLTIAAGSNQDIVITFDPSVDGNQTQTLTILSNDNDEATYTFDIKGFGETDTEDPTITAPTTVSTNTDAGICTASGVALGIPTVNDNCGNPTITNNAPLVFPSGNTNVVWTATDAAGNTASATQIVTVVDNQNPIITAPTNVNVSCPADVILGTPTSTDNCGINSTINDAPTTFPYGITTVTWTVEDFAGNTATASQTVTVNDTQNPTISTPADIAVGCPNNVVLVNPITNDNCTVASLTNDAPAIFPQGITTVTWTVTDEAGNTATSSNTVTVNDITNPTITAPTNLNLSCDDAVVLGNPITDDDCGVASVTNDAPIAPATYPLGITTVTWTVTDNSGNIATATQTVIISDTENPTITAPFSVVVPTDAGICTASSVVLGTPTTADNCGIASVTNDAPSIFPLGTTDVTWTVVDNAGNTATAIQPVTVLDRINPTMTNPVTANLLTDIDACTATNNLAIPATNDNCTIASVTSNAPTDFPIGTTIVTWTATDAAGNIITRTQTVNVVRNPASVTVTMSSPDTVICTNETTIFEATGATSYVFYRNGVEVSTSSTYEPPAGTFQNGDQVWVIGQTNSCPDTTRKMTVLVNDLPVVDLGVDKYKCSTDTTFFAAPINADYIYDWKTLDDNGDVISVGNGNDTLFVTDTGTYFVIITNTITGCSNISNQVKVFNYDDNVVVDLGEDKTICDPVDLPYRLVGSDLSHLTGTTYEWYVAGDNTIIGTDSILDVTAENTYSIVVQDPRGCEISDTIRINFTPTPDFVITGAENPNCDTFDTLYIERTNVRDMTINWFGNGIVSTSADNKTIIVNVSGIYTATITDNSTDANCTYSQSVEVFVRPNIDLGISATSDTLRLCEGDSLVLDAFRPEHNNNFDYQWRIIESNQVVSTNSKIAINYEMVNNFTANRFEVKVTDPNLIGGGSCSVLDTVIVRFDRKTGVEIDSNFIKTLCLGQTQTLTATGADAYEWSNGETSSTIEVTPTEAGYYTFIAKGTFNASLCGASADTIKFRVVNVPELSVPETLVICENDSIEVDAFLPSHQPRYVYEWTNETTGEIIDTLALHVFKQDSANITYQPQTFKVGVYDTLGGGRCGIESLITVTFSRSATPTITASDTLVCVGEEITLTAEGATNFTWNTGETTQSITVSSDSAGIFRYTVLGSYGEGENVCDSLGTSILIQFKDVPTIQLNQNDTVSICVGDSIQFIASGGTSYMWSHTPTETGDTVVVYPTDTTMYVVTGFDTLGCSSTDTVVVLAQPQIDLGADQQLCKGDTTIIGAPRPYGATYLWSTGATTDSIAVTFGGDYFVEVKINECSYTDTVNISYVNPPQLVAVDTVLCFEDEESRLIFHELGVKIKNYDSTARYRYQWIDETGEIVGEDSLLSTKYGGNYLVRVTAEYETSCNAMTSMVITASCEPELYIPTAFTPNNDYLNDEWELFGRYYENLRITVLDRWGMIVYESYTETSSDEIEFWNGQYKGKQVPAGVYYYEITYNSPKEKSQTVKQVGAVTVIY